MLPANLVILHLLSVWTYFLDPTVLLRGPNGVPLASVEAWANAATSSSFLIGQLLLVVAFVLPFIGFWTLYARMQSTNFEPGAFWGFMFSLLGTALALPGLGIGAFAGPPAAELYLQGNMDSATLIVRAFTEVGLIVGLVSAVLYTLGPILFSVALWRSNQFPQWAIVLFGLHGAGLSFGFGFFPVLVLGWLIFVLGGLGLSINMMQV